MCRKTITLLTLYSEIHALLHEEFLPASVCRAWGSGERCTQMECIHITSSAFNILNLRTCVACWNCAAGLMRIPIWFETYFTGDGIHNARNSHLWDRDNPHGTVKSKYQYPFSVNEWCGVVSLVTNWLVRTFSATSDRWYLRQRFATWTATTLREGSSTNTTSDVLPAWRSATSFQSGHQTVSES